MLLLLIRHAQAAEQNDAEYPDDTLRPLVPKGRKAQRRISKELAKRGLIPARIFSSPWKRAWQTARVTLEELGLPKSARIACTALAAPPDLEAFEAELGAIGADETIALVGHEPWMGTLASLLLAGHESRLSIDFPKSGVMGIAAEAFQPGGGTLRFFLVP